MAVSDDHEIGLVVHGRPGNWRVLLYTTTEPTDNDWRIVPNRDLFTPAVKYDPTHPPAPQELEQHIAARLNCQPCLRYELSEHRVRIFTCDETGPPSSNKQSAYQWRTPLFIRHMLKLASTTRENWEAPPALIAALTYLAAP